MKTFRLVLCLLAFLPLITLAQAPIHGTVIGVIDGNTLLVETPDDTYRVLLHGIDSPEPGQRFAEQSTNRLKELALNKKVTIHLQGRDRQGHRIGKITLDTTQDPHHEMVRSGLAWPAEKHSDPLLEALKEDARQKNIGIWSDENPVPPWTYRRQQTMLEAKSS
jgi:micrococcal nuclease